MMLDEEKQVDRKKEYRFNSGGCEEGNREEYTVDPALAAARKTANYEQSGALNVKLKKAK